MSEVTTGASAGASGVSGVKPGRLAIVFAGQGAQSVGMGSDLHASDDITRRLFAQIEAHCPGVTKYCFDGPAETLNDTLYTQPALFAVDLAIARKLEAAGIHADGVAGFSLGEIPALAYAGVLTDEQAADLVCFRARVVKECSDRHPGTMLAVMKLSADKVDEVAASVPDCWPVNYNCDGQTVVACAKASAEPLKQAVAAAGGKAMPLAVSGAFHSPYMDGASEALAERVKNEAFSAPRIPVYANRTAQIYAEPSRLIAEQVNHPVLWHKTVETMIADGFTTFIEVGPGKTLTTLIRKISPDTRVFNASNLESIEEVIRALKETV